MAFWPTRLAPGERKIRTALILAALALAGPVLAQGPLALSRPGWIAPSVEAIPQILAPATPQTANVNARIAHLNAGVPAALAACRKDAGGHGYWKRGVLATLFTSRFVSFQIIDETDCGGAYPDTAVSAIVYDLSTGRPVDWTTLLPRSLTGEPSLGDDAAGTKTVRLASPELFRLYMAGWPAAAKGVDPECQTAMTDMADDPPPFSVWLNGAREGLAVKPDTPHAIAACAVTVTIPTQALKASGASAVLLSTFADARRSLAE